LEAGRDDPELVTFPKRRNAFESLQPFERRFGNLKSLVIHRVGREAKIDSVLFVLSFHGVSGSKIYTGFSKSADNLFCSSACVLLGES
jgi:hypothetical protein